MKNLNSENPCSKPLFRRGGGVDCAFTMAEILLSLTIIGVVAAITLPSLTGNINERTWNTQRKALYARFSQAIALMPALNGYGTYTEDETGSTVEDNAAETFITAGLSKVLKINNICDNSHIADCGLTSKITTQVATKIDTPLDMRTLNNIIVNYSVPQGFTARSIYNTKAAAFETANSESILTFYNPSCGANVEGVGDAAQEKMCANFIYDLNGTKGPNTVGKDIGYITAFYSYDPSVVAPMPSTEYNNEVLSFEEATSYCHGLGEQYRIPNKDETSAIFINRRLSLPEDDTYHRWTSTLSTSNSITDTWIQHFSTGVRGPRTTVGQGNARIRCIFR